MHAHAILHTAVNQVELAAIEIPEPGLGEVLIETLYSCISPGTELRCLAGRHPEPHPWPFIPGYALVGRVVGGGPATWLAPGTLVLADGTSQASVARLWGGHVSHALQHETDVFVVPAGVAPLAAVSARLAAVAYHGLRLSRPLPHETVAVVGLGPIGQIAARLYGLAGAHVVACDRYPMRVALARQAGIEALVNQTSLVATFSPIFPDGADLIVDATGVPAVLPEAIALAKELPRDDTPTAGARYLIQGSYPDTLSLPYQAAFRKELSLHVARGSQPRDMRTILDLLARDRLVLHDLISLVGVPQQAAAIYAELREHPEHVLTAVFDWSAAPAA